jgi:hypothetical protein
LTYFLPFIFSLAACFSLQNLALRASGGRTLKSESNFFSSLGRIQAGAHAQQNAMVLGSSITGRLPDCAQGFPGISNMGCDGGNGIDVLRSIDEGILPSAPWIFIEANTLSLALCRKPTEISQAMKSPWFNLGIKASSISAFSRPAAFFYSKLLAGKIGSFDQEDAARGFGTNSVPSFINEAVDSELSADEKALIAEVSAIIERLQHHGSQCVFVWLPPARAENKASDWILQLAKSTNSYWWDYGQMVPREQVTLTDSIHMDAKSATRTTGDLLRAIQYLEQSQQLKN